MSVYFKNPAADRRHIVGHSDTFTVGSLPKRRIEIPFLNTMFSRALTIRSISETSTKLTAPVRLVIAADLHSTLYGTNQQLLMRTLTQLAPDLILMPGDMADHQVPFEGAKSFFIQAAHLAPCFYVTGNHEFWTGKAAQLKRWLAAHDITVLEGGSVTLIKNGNRLLIAGVDDPHRFTHSHHALQLRDEWKAQFAACQAGLLCDHYSILLSHRPELVSFYKDSGFDLVVSGHAHGGQVRIPGLLNGLLAPHQGFFPHYTGGRYTLGSTTLIVSRGLCLNRLPRIWNPPELVVIQLSPSPAARQLP